MGLVKSLNASRHSVQKIRQQVRMMLIAGALTLRELSTPQLANGNLTLRQDLPDASAQR
jgi:hypothetical protein